MKIKLIDEGLETGSFSLEDGQASFSIGRLGFGSDIEINASFVSRKHAEIFKDANGQAMIRDIGSSNGTFVNGQKISGDTLIKPGDKVSFSPSEKHIELKLEGEASDSVGGATEFHQAPKSAPVQDDGGATAVFSKAGGAGDLPELMKQRDSVVIGRVPGNDIVLENLVVSREHARVTKTSDGKIFVEDLGSTNGTFVNGEKATKKMALAPKDIIQIGPYQLSLSVQGKDIRKEVAIRADNIAKRYPNGKIGLQETNFKIEAGQFVAIMGPSGCGKSTLLKALNGDNPATQGRVFVHNLDLYKNFNMLKKFIGYVPQDDIVHKEITVYKSLYFAAKLRLSSDVSRADIDKKINEVLSHLNINDEKIKNTRVGELSGGQRKRVSIAVELLTDPSILFLDEPTSPLDPETIEDFLNCIRSLTAEGTTVLMVTHKPDDLHYVDSLIFLSNGGFLTYFGPKERYLDYFDKDNTIEIYSLLKTKENGVTWNKKWADEHPPSTQITINDKPLDRGKQESFFRQLYWLTARYMTIKTNDRVNTIILLAQAPFIAGLLTILFDELMLGVLFMMAISAIWFGTNNAAREIVAEAPIYQRERMFNLRIFPYVLSKLLVLSFFSLMQIVVFVGIIDLVLDLSNYGLHVGMMFGLSFSGILMGLLLSAILDSTEKVMTLVPIVLIPQIMLAGVITRISNDIIETLSYVTLARWGTEGFANIEEDVYSYTMVPSAEDPTVMVETTELQGAIDLLHFPRNFGLLEDVGATIVLSLIFFAVIMFAMKRKDRW